MLPYRLHLGLLFLCVLVLSTKTIINAQSTNDSRAFLGFLFDDCNCKCGIPNREERILGGEFLRSYEFPWLVLINIKNAKTVMGTLINNKYVITAASALLDATPYDIKITLGQNDRCGPDISSANVSIDRIIIHPDFSPGRQTYNIVLLKLVSPVIFGRRISSVCLAYPGTKYIGQVGTFVSWFGNGQENLCRPRKLGLPILGKEQCLTDERASGQDKGCAGVLGIPSVICEQDEGGPVLYRSYSGVYELIGIVSSDNSCNEKPAITAYTAISKFLPWIVQNTRDACYCYKT